MKQQPLIGAVEFLQRLQGEGLTTEQAITIRDDSAIARKVVAAIEHITHEVTQRSAEPDEYYPVLREEFTKFLDTRLIDVLNDYRVTDLREIAAFTMCELDHLPGVGRGTFMDLNPIMRRFSLAFRSDDVSLANRVRQLFGEADATPIGVVMLAGNFKKRTVPEWQIHTVGELSRTSLSSLDRCFVDYNRRLYGEPKSRLVQVLKRLDLPHVD